MVTKQFDFLFIAYSFRLNFVANTPNRFNILWSIGSVFQFLTQMPDMHSNCAAVFRVVFIFPNCMKQFLNTYNIPGTFQKNLEDRKFCRCQRNRLTV